MKVLPVLLASLAGVAACKPAEGTAAPPGEARFEGRWILDDGQRLKPTETPGDQVQLTYSAEGAWAFRFSCTEGSGEVRLHVPPKVGANTVVVSVPSQWRRPDATMTLRSTPEGAARVVTLPAGRGPFYGFVAGGRLKVDDADLSDDRAALNGDRWRFAALCRPAPAGSAIKGEPRPSSSYALMRSLHVSRAEADARLALSRGDRRYAAVCGYSCMTPGAEGPVDDWKATRVVDPTYDHVVSPEQSLLKEYARDYALAYNAVIKTAANPRPTT